MTDRVYGLADDPDVEIGPLEANPGAEPFMNQGGVISGVE